MTVPDFVRARGGLVRRIGVVVLIAALSVGLIAPARADTQPRAGAPTEAGVTAWAMHWFTEMQAGRTDRSQYAPAYRPQVTDDAVKEMSHALDKYGASPLRAEMCKPERAANRPSTS